MSGRRRDRDKGFNDPWLDNIFNNDERKAKLHLGVTIAYIVFIVLMIIGIMVVILTGLDII